MCPLRPGCFARTLARVGHWCGMLLEQIVNLGRGRARLGGGVLSTGVQALLPLTQCDALLCAGAPARDLH